MTSTEEAVRDGVAMLDEHRPGWASEIDTLGLDMSRADSCILGQLYGGYDTGMLLLRGRKDDEWSYQHGFTVDHDDDPEALAPGEMSSVWRPLTDAWVAVVEERQSPDWEPSLYQGSQYEHEHEKALARLAEYDRERGDARLARDLNRVDA